MIQLLFTLLSLEGGLVLIMMVKSPLRKVAIIGLDRMKRGRGPTVVKTIAGTFFVVLMSSIYSMAKIQNRSEDFGSMNPTDQVLMTRHLLEASLMGGYFSLPLSFFPLSMYMIRGCFFFWIWWNLRIGFSREECVYLGFFLGFLGRLIS